MGNGASPLVPPEHALLEVSPREIVVSALKPADDGDGAILRLLNPGDQPQRAVLRFGFPLASAHPVQLDETPGNGPVALEGRVLELDVPASKYIPALGKMKVGGGQPQEREMTLRDLLRHTAGFPNNVTTDRTLRKAGHPSLAIEVRA